MTVRPCTKYAVARLSHVLRQIESIETSEFSHEGARSALRELRILFEKDGSRILDIGSSGDDGIKERAVVQANYHIYKFLPILGFIQRSSNVGNPFEFYDPLLRLARKLIGDRARLIFSSEWGYSPCTYPLVFSELPYFVFIGMPSSESGNSLIIPLAGHELGHSVWSHNSLGNKFAQKVTKLTSEHLKTRWQEFCKIFGKSKFEELQTDMLLVGHLGNVTKIVIDQIEEVFCDFVGLRIFGESYFHSFEYLLAPSLGGARISVYPSIEDRIAYMERCAIEFDILIRSNFAENFCERTKSLAREEVFYIEVADSVVASLVDDLVLESKLICDRAKIEIRSRELVDLASRKFGRGMPVEDLRNLSDIINAGWVAFLDDSVWSHSLSSDEDRMNVVNEIIFKSVEIMEYRKLIEVTDDNKIR